MEVLTQCGTNCLSCTMLGATNINSCTSCVTGKYLTIVSGSTGHCTNSCNAACPASSCTGSTYQTCAASGKTPVCANNYAPSGTECRRTCTSGSYWQSSDNTCQTCDPTCATCTGSATNCASCNTAGGLTQSGTTCVCPTGKFLSGTSCSNCDPACSACTGATNT